MDRLVLSESSDVVFDRQALLRERSGREAVALLAQPGVPTLVAEDLRRSLAGLRTLLHPLPDREEAKELEALGDAYDALAEFNLGRHDTIVGVGGGAATDLAGFAAATWLRGVESVLVPTTLLGAVDAAVGGKTGLNRKGKNLVGAFWLPSRVVVDLDVLASLPEPLLREGAAEALKAGLLADPVIVEAYASAGLAAEVHEIVPRAIAVKVGVVREDPTEQGRRAILNLGHTIGHAVEYLAGLPHGHSVSVGLVAAAVVSHHRYGFDQRWLTDLLFSLGLPVAVAGVSLRAAMDLVSRDKKRTAEGIRMVLLREVGDPVVDVVSPDEVETAMRAVGLS